MAGVLWPGLPPIIDYSMRALCRKPYELHKMGCPNFAKKAGCPPGAPLWDKYFDMTQKYALIINVFPIGDHVKKMENLHPGWSDRQLYCCLYWQGTARKRLEGRIKQFQFEYPEFTVTRCPEAMGVNVTETLKSAGIELEWPPRVWAYQIAMAGIKSNSTIKEP
jgi:hypothetical protein